MAAEARPRCMRSTPLPRTPPVPRWTAGRFWNGWGARRVWREGLPAAPLLYQPGTVWDYGLSIDVIGLVVEALSGQTLGAFLEDRLFRPLGMVDTSFQV